MHWLFLLFLLSFTILLFYFIFFFSRLAFYKSPVPIFEKSDLTSGVSVIICAKNEEQNLKKFLPKILEQDHPNFEVIVVNDCSTDDTWGFLEKLDHPSLKILNNDVADENFPGKRSALMTGISAAQHEIILLTDADCDPASKNWITLMTQPFLENSNTEIVLGYSPFFKKNTLLNTFQRFENFFTALCYFSFALAKIPYMGVGRNICYRKSVIDFTPVNKDLLSGDDDLLVNRVANGKNTALMIDPQSHVYTAAPENFRAWLHQKRRHASAGFFYQPKHKALLGALYASQISFNILAGVLFIGGIFLPVIIIFLIKNILQLFIFRNAQKKLHIKGLWIFIPLLDVFLTVFFVTLGSLSFFKPKTWK